MSDVVIFQRFRVKRDTAANFTAANTVLLEGEFALETDTRKLKLGDGSTAWNSLDYVDAAFIPYDNTTSDLAAGDVQAALDELADEKLDDAPEDGITYGRKDGDWAPLEGAGGGAWAMIAKTDDETRSSTSTTPADDSDLTLNLAAGTIYTLRVRVYVNSTGGGFKYTTAYSGTLTDVVIHRRQTVALGAATSADNELTSTTTGLLEGSNLGSGSGLGAIELDIIIETDTAGAFSFQWSKNSGVAGDVTVLAGSYIEYQSDLAGFGVTSFNGRTGDVTPQAGDYTSSLISDFADAVRSTLLTGLSTATNAAIAATDTVLQALGKLQAQVSDKASLTTNNTYAGRQTFNDIVKFVQQTPELVTTGVAYGFRVSNYGNGTGTGPQWVSASSDGTESSPTNTKLNDTLGSFSFRGYDGSAFTGSKGFFTFQAAADWDASSNPTKMAIRLTPTGSTTLTTRLAITESGSILPGADNVQNFGSGSARLKEIFCGNATINTSDAREKTPPRHLTPDELAAALDIARLPCVFQWLAAIEEKGEGARLHASPTVQDVIAAMEAHGLDPMRWGFVCYDEWDEQPEVTETEPAEYDDEGNLIREEQTVVVQEYRPAGNRYSLRPSELAHFIQSAIVQEQDSIKARLAALESR